MNKCEVCGNEYDKSFAVVREGESHVFDSFQCAIQALAPHCAHCGCTIIGHGVERAGTVYCSASCARAAGVRGIADHFDDATRTGLSQFLAAAGLGIGLAWFLDPNQGRRRRALVRDQVVHGWNKAVRVMDGTWRDLRNRAFGTFTEVRSSLRREQVSDDVLVERVRSRIAGA